MGWRGTERWPLQNVPHNGLAISIMYAVYLGFTKVTFMDRQLHGRGYFMLQT